MPLDVKGTYQSKRRGNREHSCHQGARLTCCINVRQSMLPMGLCRNRIACDYGANIIPEDQLCLKGCLTVQSHGQQLQSKLTKDH